MSSTLPQDAQRVALLDNTVQVDRKKNPTRCERVQEILAQFEWKVATSICLLEFKATIIQECITIHNQLRRRGKYTQVVDALTEKDYRQVKLRGHIFRNLVNVYCPRPFDLAKNPEEDARLAEKARLRLERVIPRLYRWFVRDSVDAVLRDGVRCTRAEEAPRKKTLAFAVNLPKCRRGDNKFCRVEDFIREHDGAFLESLRDAAQDSPQLQQACELFESVRGEPERELSHSDCRNAGDCLIALEAMNHASHALSTNATEWQPLSQLLGFEFVRVDYPDEVTL